MPPSRKRHPFRPESAGSDQCRDCEQTGEDELHYTYYCPDCIWATTRIDTMAQTIERHDGSTVHRLRIGSDGSSRLA